MSSYESPEVSELRNTIPTLEEELSVLRRRLQDSPRRVRVLEERLLESPAPRRPGSCQGSDARGARGRRRINR